MLFYGRNLFAFFQGDEWYYFTLLLPLTKVWYGWLLVIYNSVADSFTSSAGAHVTPLANLIYFLNVSFFKFNYLPYAILAIVVHIINSLLVYRFTTLVLKNKIYAKISAVFFGLTYMTQGATTWIMTYVWTGLSTTFVLLCLIYLMLSFVKNEKKNLLYSSIFLFLALLTKESAATLLLLISLIIFLYSKQKIIQMTKSYIWVIAIYIPFRFILPQFYLWVDSQLGYQHVSNSVGLELMLYRFITYPIKAFVEVFIPPEWIMTVISFITPFAYPVYGVEKSVGGTNYLTFIQGAGSEMIIFSVGVFFITMFAFALKSTFRSQGKTKFHALLISMAIIVFGSWPLLLIATYAPWWGYLPFFDYRHLYIPSIGGGILFAIALVWASKALLLIARSFKFKVKESAILITLLILWGVPNFFLLQKELNKQISWGEQRKTILEEIFSSVPEDAHRKIIMVKSNTGYYGFGPIPPFQTHLGQILALYYYEKNKLPEFFIHDDFMLKNGLSGGGYAEAEGKGFGYFTNERDLFIAMNKQRFKRGDIYAFFWNGEKDIVYGITPEIREKVDQRLGILDEYDKWNEFKSDNFSLKYPTNMVLRDVTESSNILDQNIVRDLIIANNNTNIRITLKRKPKDVTFQPYVTSLKNSDGEIIDTNMTFRNIAMLYDGSLKTVIYPTNGSNLKYFIPFMSEELYFETITIEGGFSWKLSNGKEQFHELTEKIISSITEIK